ncbi:MAG: IS200/IS605 family accessory protein TnpB-related protein [Bacillota bacterium]|nr:IS200/IS605 family accessory protein TnpB-related protein [Bacillota bacterium]
MEKTYFSNRIYKNTLTAQEVLSITNALIGFNRAKHKAYKLLLAEHNYGVKHGTSVHLQIKELFGFNDYWANSAVQEAKAQLSSQKELQKIYIAGLEEQIKTRKEKARDLDRRLGRLEKLLKALMKGKFIAWKGSNITLHESGIISVDFKKLSLVFYNAYDFEKQYLRPEIKKLKNQVKLINYSATRLEEKLNKLRSGFLKGCTFGTKDLFKKQFTVEKYRNDHEAWLEEWRRARYSSLRISGRLDAKYGNFVFKYDVATRTLSFGLPDGTKVKVQAAFRYGQEEVDSAILLQGERRKPIAWAIEDHGEYYIFKVTVDVPENPYTNYYKGGGVLGLDMNYDHADLAEINHHGNLVDWQVVPHNLDGLTKGQAVKVLEQAAIDIVNATKLKKKPIVIEDLETTDSKFRLKYGSKKRNRKITLFAYRALTNAIIARAAKEGLAVFKVKPAYTSVAGKLKYMASKGIPVHIAAALVIARRGMGFKERVPRVLSASLPEKIRRRHHWAHWSYLQKQVKGIKVHDLYQLGRELEGGAPFKEALEGLKAPPRAG